MTAPVQVLVIGFDEPHLSGTALAELSRLKDAGIVQLVDLLVVERTSDGELRRLPTPDAVGRDVGDIAASLLTHASGPPIGSSDHDVEAAWSLTDAVPEGSMAVVALIEHLWATPLVEAIRHAGGQTLEETWLASGDIHRLRLLRTPS